MSSMGEIPSGFFSPGRMDRFRGRSGLKDLSQVKVEKWMKVCQVCAMWGNVYKLHINVIQNVIKGFFHVKMQHFFWSIVFFFLGWLIGRSVF